MKSIVMSCLTLIACLAVFSLPAFAQSNVSSSDPSETAQPGTAPSGQPGTMPSPAAPMQQGQTGNAGGSDAGTNPGTNSGSSSGSY